MTDGETNKEGAEPDRHLRDDRAKNMLSGVFLARPSTGYVAKCASHRSMGSICPLDIKTDGGFANHPYVRISKTEV